MRPLRLKMTAFGPFCDSEEIDFRDLGDNRLFLIHGKTGSGKSTILDGICAALYGETAGNERKPEQMRSDHAKPETETALELDFAIGKQAYRIERKPEQPRPKRRGEGFTTLKTEATLWKLSGPEKGAGTEEVLAERKVSDVSRAVKNLLGFDAGQFRQVVVLPQGQFRRLLSEAKEDREARETILERLFDTTLYLKAEHVLNDRAKTMHAEIKVASVGRDKLLEAEGLESLDGLKLQLDDRKNALKELKAEVDRVQALDKKQQQALTNATTLDDQFVALEKAQQAQKAYQQGAPAIHEAKGTRERAEKARALEPQADALAKAQAELKTRVAVEVPAVALLQARDQELKRAAASLRAAEQAQALEPKHRRQHDALKKRVEQARSWTTRSAERQQKAEQAGRDQQALQERQGELKTQTALRNELKQQLDTLEDSAEACSKAQASEKELRIQLEWRCDLEEKDKDLSELKESAAAVAADQAAAARAHDGAKVAEAEVQRKLVGGRAVLLAAQLQAEAPCPVCGSQDHPAPATGDDSLPTDEAQSETSQALEAATTALSVANEQVAATTSRLDEKGQALKLLKQKRPELAGQTVEELKQQVTRAGETLKNARERVIRRDAIRESLDDAEQALQQRTESCADAKVLATRTGSELKAAEKEEAGALKALGGETPKVETWQTEMTELERQIDAAKEGRDKAREASEGASVAQAKARAEADNAVKERSTAQSAQTKAEGQFAKQLEESTFEDAAAFEAARMETKALQQLAQRIKTHDDELLVLKDRITEQKKKLKDKTRPALEEIRNQAGASQKLLEEAKGRHVTLEHELTRGEELLKKIVQEMAETQTLEERYKVLGELANVAKGSNTSHLSLHRFVLTIFLDDVLELASVRLREMTGQRFTLERRKEVDDKRKGQGLSLNVFDQFTGELRPVTTLSGGEGFLASLSLALGLAEVVQSYAGGITLETIFVDEGFGSLDSETLDLAVQTLLGLQKGGRLVGVISHVGELRERIDVRLEVKQTDSGSHAQFELPS